MSSTTSQGAFLFSPQSDEHLTVSALETWLWDAACKIRGAADAPKFKDFILPLVFYKRLSDVFDDEFAGMVEFFDSDEIAAREIVEADHVNSLRTGDAPIVRFYIPAEYRWSAIRHHATKGLGEFITEAMRDVAKRNPELEGVLDVKDYNERMSGQRTLDDEKLSSLAEVISRHRLGLKNAEPDILGRAYEYLLRKFAEGQGQSAGEFYTPKEVGWLMAELLDPMPKAEIYDPACGSAGLLIKARLVYDEHHPDDAAKLPRLFGQEQNPVTYSMAKMNMFLRNYTDAQIAIGDTFSKPGFAATGAGLRKFDYVIANPMWNQDNFTQSDYDNDLWSRFDFGSPSLSSGDWGWAQHILASLRETGRAAIVLDTGAVSRGSGSKSNNKEKEIRKAFVEHDYIEGVILLPENLFYNTPSPGIILLLNRSKAEERKGQFLLMNASAYFVKEKPKNRLTDEGIAEVVQVYRQWETREKLSRAVTLAEVRAADYNLSPSQFVEVGERVVHRPLAEIVADLRQAGEERAHVDTELQGVLAHLGLV